jgi:hypothetical protein
MVDTCTSVLLLCKRVPRLVPTVPNLIKVEDLEGHFIGHIWEGTSPSAAPTCSQASGPRCSDWDW